MGVGGSLGIFAHTNLSHSFTHSICHSQDVQPYFSRKLRNAPAKLHIAHMAHNIPPMYNVTTGPLHIPHSSHRPRRLAALSPPSQRPAWFWSLRAAAPGAPPSRHFPPASFRKQRETRHNKHHDDVEPKRRLGTTFRGMHIPFEVPLTLNTDTAPPTPAFRLLRSRWPIAPPRTPPLPSDTLS